MEVFHDATQHARTCREEVRVGGLAGKAAGAEVFVDENPHGVVCEALFCSFCSWRDRPIAAVPV